MTQGDMLLAWIQHQEYIQNQAFEREQGFMIEDLQFQDGYVSMEEREEELCSNSQQQSQ